MGGGGAGRGGARTGGRAHTGCRLGGLGRSDFGGGWVKRRGWQRARSPATGLRAQRRRFAWGRWRDEGVQEGDRERRRKSLPHSYRRERARLTERAHLLVAARERLDSSRRLQSIRHAHLGASTRGRPKPKANLARAIPQKSVEIRSTAIFTEKENERSPSINLTIYR